MARFAVNKTVIRIEPSKLIKGELPPVLEETLLQVPKPAGGRAWETASYEAAASAVARFSASISAAFLSTSSTRWSTMFWSFKR